MERYKIGDTAWILESKRFLREVRIHRVSGSLIVVRFANMFPYAGIAVRPSRLYRTKEEAEAAAAAERGRRG